MTKRQRRTFTPEFKEQMVKFYESGKPKNDIMKEYDLTVTAFNSQKITDIYMGSVALIMIRIMK